MVENTMKIGHVSFSSNGGAGRVASSLVQGQRLMGHSVELLTSISHDLKHSPTRFPKVTLAAGIDEFILKNPKFSGHTNILRSRNSSMPPSILEGLDIINFHWIEGVFPAKDLPKIVAESKAKAFWTIHDMAPFTACCHQSLGCNKFERDCAGCPATRAPFRGIAANNLKIRKKMSETGQKLHLIAPSRWLGNQISKSTNLQNHRLSIVPNPISLDFFSITNLSSVDSADHVNFVVTAAQLDDPSKRIVELTKIFKRLANTPMCRSFTLFLVGSLGNLKLEKHVWLRPLGRLDASELASCLEQMHVNVSYSLAESAGMTVTEAGAMGVPSIVLDHTGLGEQVINNQTGLLAENELEFEFYLRQLLRGELFIDRLKGPVQQYSHSRSHPSNVSRKYIDLYGD